MKMEITDLPNLIVNKSFIIGIDEVGMGPLAGPVVACGFKVPINWEMSGLNDSKKLSPAKRRKMSESLIKEKFYLAERSNDHIDQHGLYGSLKDAYFEIINNLKDNSSIIIIDGDLVLDNVPDSDYFSLIKADGLVPAVMAASVIAKVCRDNKMQTLHNIFPQYNWKKNSGYPTKDHKKAIKKSGLTVFHRKSFKINI